MSTDPASIDKIAAALAKAQGAFLPIIKDRMNPHFRNKYATLDALLTATRPALSANELAIMQTLTGGDRLELRTTLMHASGQSITSTVPLTKLAGGPQAFGSELTYLRRYTYAAALSIAADEDDDGTAAQEAGTAKTVAAKPAAAPKATAAKPAAEAAEDPARAWVNKLLASMEPINTEAAMKKLMETPSVVKNREGIKKNRPELDQEIADAGRAMLERIGKAMADAETAPADDDTFPGDIPGQQYGAA